MTISHLPVWLHEISEDDKKTYKRWARISFTFYFGLIACQLVVGFSTRQPQELVVTEKQAVRSGSVAKLAGHHHPGG